MKCVRQSCNETAERTIEWECARCGCRSVDFCITDYHQMMSYDGLVMCSTGCGGDVTLVWGGIVIEEIPI